MFIKTIFHFVEHMLFMGSTEFPDENEVGVYMFHSKHLFQKNNKS